MLKPLINWLLPQIRAAQDEGTLPRVEPILLHYLLISPTSTLSGFGPEMLATSNVSASDPAVVDAYWRIVEKLIFDRQPVIEDKAESISGKPDKRPRVSARANKQG